MPRSPFLEDRVVHRGMSSPSLSWRLNSGLARRYWWSAAKIVSGVAGATFTCAPGRALESASLGAFITAA